VVFDYFITPGHFCACHRFGVCQIEDSIAFFGKMVHCNYFKLGRNATVTNTFLSVVLHLNLMFFNFLLAVSAFIVWVYLLWKHVKGVLLRFVWSIAHMQLQHQVPMVLWIFLYTTFPNSCIINILVCVLLGLTTHLLAYSRKKGCDDGFISDLVFRVTEYKHQKFCSNEVFLESHFPVWIFFGHHWFFFRIFSDIQILGPSVTWGSRVFS